MKKLFPICRSITGNGVRKTFEIIQDYMPLEVCECPSGTECFDWTVPDEWNIESAYIENEAGERIVDFADNNLHVMSYSEPVSGVFSLAELKEHLYSSSDQPDVIPYLTSYYKRRWGFCLTDKQKRSLPEGNYKVEIKSTLEPGALTYAEAFIPGKSEEEIFFSCYVCHPSMANDSLSGVVLNVFLYNYLKDRKDNYYSYRFVFVPETIGALVYLSNNKDRVLEKTKYGLVLTCLGDEGAFNYKRTKFGSPLDTVVENVLKFSGCEYNAFDFALPGSDERQYCSPGFNLTVGSLMRSCYGFTEYHTSADDLNFVTEKGLRGTYDMYCKIVEALEGNYLYRNLKPYGEPFLSKYELRDTVGAPKFIGDDLKILLYILSYSDDNHSLIDIAEKMDVSILDVIRVAETLEEKGLIQKLRIG